MEMFGEHNEGETVRQEQLAVLRAIQDKIETYRLQRGDSEIQIAHLKSQIATAPDTELPAITGERVKQLKEYQALHTEAETALPEYEEKLRVAKERYRKDFSQFLEDLL